MSLHTARVLSLAELEEELIDTLAREILWKAQVIRAYDAWGNNPGAVEGAHILFGAIEHLGGKQ